MRPRYPAPPVALRLGTTPLGKWLMPPSSPPASLFRRLAAALYDLLLLAGILMLTSFIIIIAKGGAAIPAGTAAYQGFVAAQIASFFIGFWARGGQTLGMRAWHIRVEAVDGSAITLPTAALRFVTALISAAPLGLGFAWVLVDPDGRAWHDRLSGTRVAWLRQG